VSGSALKFLIAGRDAAVGTDRDDIRAERPYFELGWEAVTTHFEAKRIVLEEADAHRTIVVTCFGREFLYRAVTPRVISFAHYRSLVENGLRHDELDLTRAFSTGIPAHHIVERDGVLRYHGADRLESAICSFDASPILEHYDGGDYACLAFRRRAHHSSRNMAVGYAREVVAALRAAVGQVFVVGHGAEALAPDGGAAVTLRDFVTLIASPRCRAVVGTLTGPIQLANVFSAAELLIVEKLSAGQRIEEENHPIHLGPCVRFTGSRIVYADPGELPELLHAAL
jgi:hypothetical protein